MSEGSAGMISSESIRFELAGRMHDIPTGKSHISVRWEPAPRVARVGACIANYDWETRAAVLDALLDYEHAHADEFALEFDIVPLDAVNDADYAEL